MTAPHQSPHALERVPTGVRGLDVVLRGGLLRGGLYLITGTPGSGKTVLANQLCFHHVAADGHAVYLTLLTESHSRMLAHLGALTFFNALAVGANLHYFSGFGVLDTEGIETFSTFVRTIIRDQRATLLVIDGLENLRAAVSDDIRFKHFLHELHAFGEASQCTTLLLSQAGDDAVVPGATMVDGLLMLRDEYVGLRAVRGLEVQKFRGSSYLRGQHLFDITDDGIVVHPRTETVLATPQASVSQRERLLLGIARLDGMLQGGLLSGSSTMLLGSPGSGKTLLGLHFLTAGASVNETGLYFGVYESPADLVAKADAVGLALGKAVTQGKIELLWQPPLEDILDVYAERILEAVQRREIRRLFIDGLDTFQQAVNPERFTQFFTALASELRACNVTTICSVELRQLLGDQVEVPLPNLSGIVDNIVLLRYAELRSHMYRLISIFKMRASGFDGAIREFRITGQGIEVAETLESAEAILTGIARTIPPADTPSGAHSTSLPAEQS